MSERQPGERASSGVPEGTHIVYNPSQADRDSLVGAARGSELLGHHGSRFHLIYGANRIAIEITHFVRVRRGFFRKTELVLDRALHELPEGTSSFEARRVGYELVHRHPKQPL